VKQIITRKFRIVLLAITLVIPLGSLASCSKVEKDFVEKLALREGEKNPVGSLGSSIDYDLDTNCGITQPGQKTLVCAASEEEALSAFDLIIEQAMVIVDETFENKSLDPSKEDYQKAVGSVFTEIPFESINVLSKDSTIIVTAESGIYKCRDIIRYTHAKGSSHEPSICENIHT
jgi:hypothetical protein